MIHSSKQDVQLSSVLGMICTLQEYDSMIRYLYGSWQVESTLLR